MDAWASSPSSHFWSGPKAAWLNDAVGDARMHPHLLELDTVHGRWDADFASGDQSITIDGTRLPVHAERDLAKLSLDVVDVVIHCTGAFRSEAALAPYFEAGVKNIVVSAPVKDGARRISSTAGTTPPTIPVRTSSSRPRPARRTASLRP